MTWLNAQIEALTINPHTTPTFETQLYLNQTTGAVVRDAKYLFLMFKSSRHS